MSMSGERRRPSACDFSSSALHSRSSSKTLKCPKCNWHYKSSETLEIHCREKHPVGSTSSMETFSLSNGEKEKEKEKEEKADSCVYCLSGVVHPRLSRGEQYPCGFKPYRCDLCLYSTTTKGNLSIHLQSDKHLNNFQDLSSEEEKTNSALSHQLPRSEMSLSVEEMFPPSSSLVVVPSDPRNSIEDANEDEEDGDVSISCPMVSIDPSKSSCSVVVGVNAMLPSSSSSDEYRCHCCPNVIYGQCSLLFDHFFDRNHLIEEKSKIGGYLCWKKGCNQYFPSLSPLEKHFRSIHQNDSPPIVAESRLRFVHRCRERLFSIGEDVVEHYLENLSSSSSSSGVETRKNELICDLCSKTFSSLSRLKVHYEEIHFIRLSSSAIEHWIFLVDKLHQSSSSPLLPPSSSSKKKKREMPLESVDCSSSSTKRQRTRISDEQLLILRDHFDLNHSPCDEQIEFIARKTDLTVKVIKHWFRNTLFKERQRNKDSPYNFSNPPTTLNQFDLDEYHKTGTIIPKSSPPTATATVVVVPPPPPPANHFTSDCDTDEEDDDDEEEEDEEDLLSTSDSNDDLRPVAVLPPPAAVPPLTCQQQQQQQSRRANRTRFTDEQLRYLQEAFEGNPYPKDDDLEILSQKLKLNSRVIVVWFQNARQKARKSYENNQNDSPSPLEVTTPTTIVEQTIKQDKDEGYSCKNCSKLFVRFAELMKHAKQCSSSPSSSSTFFNPKKTSMKKVEFPSYSPLIIDLPSSSSSSRVSKYSCDQCEKCFSSLTLLSEHQCLHMQQALLNAAAFFPLAAAAAYHPAAAACAAAMAALNSQLFQQQTTPNVVLKTSVSSIGSDSSTEMEEEDGGTSLDSSDSVSPRKLSLSSNGKRNRTTILPEQQDFLLSRYSLESNPSRKMLEDISSQVKLKKRVVQVWFQNTRARERKGNIKVEHSSSSAEKKSISLFASPMLNNFKPSLDELPLDLSKSSRLNLPEDDVAGQDEEDWSEHSTDDDERGQEEEEEEELTISTKKVSSSSSSRLNGVEVMSPSGSQQSLSGQRRFRTQMSPLQIKLMKSLFLEYRTPTMPECELLGKEISLQKRVVQVWFQNARAKEKKNPHFFKSDLPEQFQPSQQSCLLCQHQYTIDNPQRDHLFTSKHIDNLRSQFIDPRLSKSLDESKEKNSQIELIGQQQQSTSFPSSSTVFDHNNKDHLISYFNLMNFMPLDPFNYGLMDPTIHGTPIFMLQLPCEAIEKILSSMKSDSLLSRTEYSQDGLHHQRRRTHPTNCQTIDVGFLCKRCHLVWPLYESCRCHALMCWQLSPSLIPLTLNSTGESNCLAQYVLKIEQCLYRCPTCERSYPTWMEFDQHLQDQTNQLCKSNSSNSTIQENDSNEL